MNVDAPDANEKLEITLHVEVLSRNLTSITANLSKAMRVKMDSRGCEIIVKAWSLSETRDDEISSAST
ncbi:hypothetical protein PsorP6_007207 [Peronosclerospora sorghi]|uniref:Uncharacterized protein n=1 Tax=Peronosclerospora sorghi TaxID=230839 RepID=A0ACC0WAN1_9STRA|nr:hypothetical protein PsorP6_007207 [Peronosclerospora sorghi]